MKRRVQKAIPVLLAAVLLLLSLGCGWDNTPQYVIATPAAATATPFARWTASPVPEGYETPTPAATPEPEDTESPSGSPAGTDGATPGATKNPNSTEDPSVTPTPDPYLIGKWEFKRGRYKGKELAVTETNQRMLLWLFSNGSAEMNIYEISANTDPPQNTQGVQWRMDGATMTLTLYGETIMVLKYDGTYLVMEQEVFDSTFDFIFEKTGE